MAKASEKMLSLQVDIDDALRDQWFVGDAKRIQQVLLNLLWNSLKFTPQGFVKLVAKLVAAGDSQAEVLFEVVDSGVGIPLEYQENIFQRYSPLTKRRMNDAVSNRLDSTGTGLGMSICKELVELMGGRIWLKSKPLING